MLACYLVELLRAFDLDAAGLVLAEPEVLLDEPFAERPLPAVERPLADFRLLADDEFFDCADDADLGADELAALPEPLPLDVFGLPARAFCFWPSPLGAKSPVTASIILVIISWPSALSAGDRLGMPLAF